MCVVDKDGRGLVIWLCGLAGSGKSTIGRALSQKLREKIPNVVYLDGDELRDLLGAYGYDREGRIEVALKRSKFAHFLSSQGQVVVVTTISLFDEIYQYNRETLKNYLEVYVKCDLEELKRRDQKGLYSKALNGEIRDVVGIDIAYDNPNADVVIENSEQNNLDKKLDEILKRVTI
ncbi:MULTISPECIES: adenylyl-sulfate kinase [Helicobacter]|uniref:Adenylyl-sulfate kinase n=1 Tax=Helicobacter ibis TaxID=2962633 RepID=A0ABT4VCB4_9HELI|nr:MULTISPECIES: adenylyl-sulfate kinase [Helicobacter]MDA3967585.1 adenylyl-sulfate kinase [Helicobacter sp. WB40]MDA3968338.1 adenylyl-sulfate kinase [Helicobacter ibis]